MLLELLFQGSGEMDILDRIKSTVETHQALAIIRLAAKLMKSCILGNNLALGLQHSNGQLAALLI